MNPIYTYTVPLFLKHLEGLKTILTKAKADADAGTFSEADLVNDRLAPDMFPFARQVQVATDHAKGLVARLSNLEVPQFVDTETTLAELISRVEKTMTLLAGVSEEAFTRASEKKVTLPYFPGKYMDGADYAREYALPNFFFHTCMAYALIRKAGVDIGKADFVARLPLKDEAV